jgi:formate dehydrogenase subunit gamma
VVAAAGADRGENMMTKMTKDECFSHQLASFARKRAQLLPALHLAQATFGHVPNSAVERIAAHLRMTVNDVDGVASAYPELSRVPPGQRVVRVCTGVGCRDGEHLLAALKDALEAGDDETRAGGVRVEETACCFCCAVAPVVDIDGTLHGRVTAERLLALVNGDLGRKS